MLKLKQPDAARYVLNDVTGQQARVMARIPELDVWLLQVSAGQELALANRLRRDSRVWYVSLNHRVRALEGPDSAAGRWPVLAEEPNDPAWRDQWSLPIVRAPEAWNITHSKGIVIAIVDSGIYLQHPDLRGVLWTNPREIAGNGLDDDGNGKVDDMHGWHFFHQWNGSAWEPYENPIVEDDLGHGTHVSGIAAAETNNSIGIAGLSWGAQVMPVKVLDQDGRGWAYDVAQGIVYAANNGARIINLSLGDPNLNPLYQDAVNYAYGKGALLVAAAGNYDLPIYYPAACSHVMAVAATGYQDERLDFCNRGPEMDIAAPGYEVYSTWIEPYLYRRARGTSQATPHIAGAAALLWTWRPDWTNDQIEQRLESTADDVNRSTHPGWDAFLGWGRLNVFKALEGLAPGPTPTSGADSTPTVTPSATPTQTASPTRTLEPTSSPTPTETVASSPTASPSATDVPTASPTPSPTLTSTSAPADTRTPTPTTSPTPTPPGTGACVGWEEMWQDEFDDASLPLWRADWGEGVGQVQASVLSLRASEGGSLRFPLLWAPIQLPVEAFSLQLRFRYGTPTPYGTTIGVGSAPYDGALYYEGEPRPPGIEDVLSIHQLRGEFRILLGGVPVLREAGADTAWHVVQLLREDHVTSLWLDGRCVATASQIPTPRGIFLGNPAIMHYPGAWTPLDLDYVHISACTVWGNQRIWLPLIRRR